MSQYNEEATLFSGTLFSENNSYTRKGSVRGDCGSRHVQENPQTPRTDGRQGSSGRRRSRPVTCPQDVLEGISIPEPLRTEEFVEAWLEWIDYRIDSGKQNRWNTNLRCFEKSIRKCAAWGPDRAVSAIDLSIEMGWRGIFESRISATTDNDDNWKPGACLRGRG